MALNYLQRVLAYLFPAGYKAEAVALLKLASPAIATAFLLSFLFVINVFMCGRFGGVALNAISLGNSILIVLGTDFGNGLATACDTLFSQTFGGSSQKRLGVLVQKSFYVMFMFVFPIASIFVNMEPLLILAHQDPQVAWVSATYLTIAIPSLFFNFAFMILARYMQAQNCMLPVLFLALGGNVVSIAVNFITFYVLQLNFVYSAASFDITMLCMAIGAVVYIRVTNFHKATWNGWSRYSIYDIGGFLKLGISGLLMVGLESWWSQVTVLLAGIMGDAELGAQSIIMQYESLTYTISEGIATAVSVRVGQHAGANNVDGAWTTMWVALSFVPIGGSLLGAFYIALADYLPWVFTNDPEVAALTSAALPILGGTMVVDLTVNALNGTIRGFGKQYVGAVVCFIGTYLVNLPTVVVLVYVCNWSVSGIWVGFLVGGVVMLCLNFVYLVRLDMNEACANCDESIPLTSNPQKAPLLCSSSIDHQPPDYSSMEALQSDDGRDSLLAIGISSNKFASNSLPITDVDLDTISDSVNFTTSSVDEQEEEEEEAMVNDTEAGTVGGSHGDQIRLVSSRRQQRESNFLWQAVRAAVIYNSGMIVFIAAVIYQLAFYPHNHDCPSHHCGSNYTYNSTSSSTVAYSTASI